MMLPLSLPSPDPTRTKRNEEAREIAPTDFDLMIRAWHSGPAGRDVALEIADRNRENARSVK